MGSQFAEVVPILLVSVVPTIALFVSGWILVEYRNWFVASVVLLVALAVAAYGVLSLVAKEPKLLETLQTGQVSILVIWSCVHFVLLAIMACRLIMRSLYSY